MEYLSPEQVAERFQLSPHTLKEWRYKGVGPKYVRLGKHVRYPAAALEAWEAERARAQEATRPA
jgi:predicted DNA-binding transcriptional regulator AlpA